MMMPVVVVVVKVDVIVVGRAADVVVEVVGPLVFVVVVAFAVVAEVVVAVAVVVEVVVPLVSDAASTHLSISPMHHFKPCCCNC